MRTMPMFVLFVLSLGLVSCQSVMSPQYSPVPVDGQSDSAALAYQIAQETWCTNDQACAMILHLYQGQDGYSVFSDRYQALVDLDVARAGWKLQGDQPVTKGTLAFMLCRALNVKGGVMFRVLPIRRYAYRELLDIELMTLGSEFEPLTGPEAVGIFSRAARLAADKNAGSL